MKDIIKAIETATQIPVKPFGTETIEKCICYTIYPISDDGVVAQDRLELRLITNTLSEADELKKAILKILLTIGDTEKYNYKSCIVNGGGQLKDFNTNTIHTILYFVITRKSEVIA